MGAPDSYTQNRPSKPGWLRAGLLSSRGRRRLPLWPDGLVIAIWLAGASSLAVPPGVGPSDWLRLGLKRSKVWGPVALLPQGRGTTTGLQMGNSSFRSLRRARRFTQGRHSGDSRSACHCDLTLGHLARQGRGQETLNLGGLAQPTLPGMVQQDRTVARRVKLGVASQEFSLTRAYLGAPGAGLRPDPEQALNSS